MILQWPTDWDEPTRLLLTHASATGHLTDRNLADVLGMTAAIDRLAPQPLLLCAVAEALQYRDLPELERIADGLRGPELAARAREVLAQMAGVEA